VLRSRACRKNLPWPCSLTCIVLVNIKAALSNSVRLTLLCGRMWSRGQILLS
jgi:hypothetical protein